VCRLMARLEGRQEVFAFESRERDVGVLVQLFGELDVAAVGDLRAELDRIQASGCQELVVDLRELDFMDSTGLHLLLRVDANCARDGIRLRLVPGPAAVQRLFEVTGTDVRFDFIEPPDASWVASSGGSK
jgi:anti-anti-sigma factor